MPLLAKSVIMQVVKTLNQSFFTSSGFAIEVYEDHDKFFKITFNDVPEYSFTLSYFPNRNGQEIYQSIEVPGAFMATETKQINGFANVLSQVAVWMSRIQKEIFLADEFDEKFESFKEEIDQQMKSHLDDENAHFTKGEKDELLAKLRELEARFTLESEGNAERERELTELKGIVEGLTKAASGLSKQAWFRTAASQFYAFTAKMAASEAGQTLISTELQKLLGIN